VKFLLDESVDLRVANFLEDLGDDVNAVALHYQRSILDTQVLAIAHREGRTLITNDRGFGELVFHYGQPHTGVIYLGLGTFELDHVTRRLSDVLQRYSERLNEFVE
jgi:predicted nuclease of predicted toxin-antitoxin system